VAVTLTDAAVEPGSVSTPDDSAIAGRSAKSEVLGFVVLAVIAVAALIHVPFPFWGDQALFAYAGHGLRHGDRLYVDIWDVKQPGIYLWYLISGTIFGFRETGIHVAELIWSVAFAACIQRVMRSRVEHRWVADIAPLLTVGAFYAAARGWDLTQIEYLVAFPLFISLWAAAAADSVEGPRHSRLLFASGLAASVVGYFKLVYVLIPLVFWIYLLVARRRSDRSREAGRDSATLVAGLALPMLPLLVYFVQHHLLGTMWWTYVTYPPKVVRSLDPPPWSRLRAGAWYFAENFAWLGVLSTAAFGVLRTRVVRRRDPLAVGLAIWFVVGSATILIQNRWGYLFMLLVVPLGLYACYGIDRLRSDALRRASQTQRRRPPSRTIALVICAAVLAVYPAKQIAHKVKTLAGDDFALSAAGRQKFDDTFAPYYAQARAAAAYVRQPGRSPGPIYVEGNPLIQYLSGRDFALREQGWAPEQSDSRLWKWTDSELRDRRPVYLWLDQFSRQVMHRRSPETLTLINAMYCSTETIGDGTWYALRGSRECEGTNPS
jgi:hypothetical protein